MLPNETEKIKYVYKYRNFSEYHIKALLENKTWFSVSSQFNDPFDSSVYLMSDRVRLGDLINYLSINEPDLLSSIYQKAKLLDCSPIELLYNGVKDRGFGHELMELIVQNLERTYIFSATLSPYNKLMWSHYADFHKGFCIRYKVEKLNECDVRHSGKVDYKNERVKFLTLLHNQEQFFTEVDKTILTKSKEWEYEEEYRFTLEKMREKDTENGSEFKKASVAIEHPEGTVDRIYFGMMSNESDKIMLKELLKEKDIRFYNIIPKVGNTFDLCEELIKSNP